MLRKRLVIKREVLTELTPEHLGVVVGAADSQIAEILQRLASAIGNCAHTCDDHCTAISNTRSLDGSMA